MYVLRCDFIHKSIYIFYEKRKYISSRRGKKHIKLEGELISWVFAFYYWADSFCGYMQSFSLYPSLKSYCFPPLSLPLQYTQDLYNYLINVKNTIYNPHTFASLSLSINTYTRTHIYSSYP